MSCKPILKRLHCFQWEQDCTSSQSCCSVHADAWCKRALNRFGGGGAPGSTTAAVTTEITIGDRDVTCSLTTEYTVNTSPALIIFGSIDFNINVHIKRRNLFKVSLRNFRKDRKVHRIKNKLHNVNSNVDQWIGRWMFRARRKVIIMWIEIW